MKVPRGSGVPPRYGAAVTLNAAAARPAPSRRDAAPTGSLHDFHGKALDSCGQFALAAGCCRMDNSPATRTATETIKTTIEASALICGETPMRTLE